MDDDINVLLSGIVGSTAYGLAGPASDIDRLGVFALPTTRFYGLYPPKETALSRVQVKPDITLHEAGKLCRLLIKCNPSVMDLLWLPPELYDVQNVLGDDLIEIRQAFLSADAVRRAYFNYARDQAVKLANGGPSGEPDTEETLVRRKKNARHILRLLDQGLHLYRTGELIVQVDDPKRYFDFGEDALRNPDLAKGYLAVAEASFDRQPSALPEHADVDAIQEWLHSVRAHYHKV